MIIDMHDDRLAATCSIPHSDFIKVALPIRLIAIIWILGVKIGNIGVQSVNQPLTVVKIFVEVKFDKKQREILKVF